jgi:RND family efflux transporter MFP subunit
MADREVIVSAEVAGQVVEANRLDVGRAASPPRVTTSQEGTSSNTSGDLLVRIDPQTYEERVLQARKLLAQDVVELKQLAQENDNNLRLLETAEQNLETSTKDYDSALALRNRRVGTESAVRKAQLELRQYEDAVKRLKNDISLYNVRREGVETRRDSHQSDLALALLDLERTQVRPPFPGVISEVFVEQGQYVTPGEPLIRLTDPSRVEVPLSVTLSDFLDIAALRGAGRRVRVSLAENETSEARWFSDPLGDLRQAPEADERTRTVKVYTEVDNTRQELPLLPGTFVHARIPGPVVQDAIVIPRDALIDGTVFVAVPVSESPEDSTWTARVERRSVTNGRTLQSLVSILDGLHAGEWIVTTNLDVIFDGAQLKIERGLGERSLRQELAQLRSPQVRIVDEDELR